MVGIPKDFNLE